MTAVRPAVATVHRALSSLCLAIAVSLLLSGQGGCTASEPPATDAAVPAPSTHKNVIVILMDDLGYGDTEPYGQRIIKTPVLAQLAREGARFTQFYANAWCPPSRSSLLDGRHSGLSYIARSGSYDDAWDFFPEQLQAAGYVTGLFGKWHSAEVDEQTVLNGGPRALGFDSGLAHLTGADAHGHYLDGRTRKPTSPRIQPRDYLFAWDHDGYTTKGIPPGQWTQDAFIDAALAFIDRHTDERFFIYLPLTTPHADLVIPRHGDPGYRAGDRGLLEQYLNPDGSSRFEEQPFPGDDVYGRPIATPYANYAGIVSRIDRDVGRLIDRLRAHGIAEDTVVFFTSDNGPHDEGGIDAAPFDLSLETPFDSTGGLRGLKRSLYEGGIRVPLIVWGPGTVAAGTEVQQPFALWDISATVADLTQTRALTTSTGISMRPALSTPATSDSPNLTRETPLYWETSSIFRGQALRVGAWKAIRTALAGPLDKVELYHLGNDPGETNDLSTDPQQCQRLNVMKDEMNRIHAAGDSQISVPPLAVVPCTAPQRELPLPADRVEFTGDSGSGAGGDVDGAYIRGGGSISLAVDLPVDGVYQLQLRAAQKTGSVPSSQIFKVLVDGTDVGRHQPPDRRYREWSSSRIPLVAGRHRLEIVGLKTQTVDVAGNQHPDGHTVLLDQLRWLYTPPTDEPSD